jgi:hypothetical protein
VKVAPPLFCSGPNNGSERIVSNGGAIEEAPIKLLAPIIVPTPPMSYGVEVLPITVTALTTLPKTIEL